jgi:hypothetical protein
MRFARNSTSSIVFLSTVPNSRRIPMLRTALFIGLALGFLAPTLLQQPAHAMEKKVIIKTGHHGGQKVVITKGDHGGKVVIKKKESESD